MYQTSIIDRTGTLSRLLTASNAWKSGENQNFTLVSDPNLANVIWIAVDRQDTQTLLSIQHFSSLHQNAAVILLCRTQNNDFTRNAFLSGVSDCLTLPVPDQELKRIFHHLEQKFAPEQSPELIHAEQDFIHSLLNYGIDAEEKLNLLLATIYSNCQNSGISMESCFSLVRDRLLLLLLQKAPFLEHYLWRNIFSSEYNTPQQFSRFWLQDCRMLISILSRYQNFHQQHVREAARYIMQHPDGKLSLNEIASATHLNSSYLSHLFRQETGITLVQYITEQKVNRAKILLLNDEMKVHEIAILLGYNEAEYFRKIFKHTCGQSPSACKTELLRQYDLLAVS